jgi:hypothetical protein
MKKPEYILEILSQFKICDYLDARGISPSKGGSGGDKTLYSCPFPNHNDSTPSFYVFHNEYDRFMCFGCNQQGDIINLISQMEGLSLKQAISRLAKKAGIDESSIIDRIISDISASSIGDLSDIVIRLNLLCLSTIQDIDFEPKYVQQIDKAFEKVDMLMRTMDEGALEEVFDFMFDEAFPVIRDRYERDQDGS